ncbi:MAG: YlxR family protein [Eubacterium sp.]|nr:YlxR family protein [Eubacterium sp.]
MSLKKSPLRMCIGCRQMIEKSRLVRVVRFADGQTKIDETGKAQGRGAYVCRNPECVQKAVKTGALARSFKGRVSTEVYEALLKRIEVP